MIFRITFLFLIIFGMALQAQAKDAVGVNLEAASEKYKENVTLPDDGDDYSDFVQKLVASDKTLDLMELRRSWLTSEARRRSRNSNIKGLRHRLKQARNENNYQEQRNLSEQILSLNYADFAAHKYLEEACAAMADVQCANFHHKIVMGSLNAVNSHGDGTSCKKGWSVLSRDEEHLFMDAVGMVLISRKPLKKGEHFCDQLEVTNTLGVTTIFFNTDGLFVK